MIETINAGQPLIPFMQFSDCIRIEMMDDSELSIFGAIDQCVTAGEAG